MRNDLNEKKNIYNKIAILLDEFLILILINLKNKECIEYIIKFNKTACRFLCRYRNETEYTHK